MFLDILCLVCSYLLAFSFRFSRESQQFTADYLNLIVVMAVLLVVLSALLGNLRDVIHRNNLTELLSVLELTVLLLASTVLYIYTLHISDFYSRILIYLTLSLFVAIDFLARVLFKKHLMSKPYLTSRSIALVCDCQHADMLIEELQTERVSVSVVVYTDEEHKTGGNCHINGDNNRHKGEITVIPLTTATDYFCRNWIDEVIVYGNVSQEFSEACATMGITVHSILDVHNAEKHKQFVEEIGNRTVLTTAYNYILPYQAIVKRIADIIGGIVGCLVTALLFVFVGPAIMKKSPGPILFKQERIGRNGKRFNMYKFRSMYMDAEERKKDFQKENRIEDGLMFKVENDPRIIPGIGQFIRKTSIDEFPQFWNVLKGDMSLVGTRPPTVDEWEKYEYHHRARLAIKPGITGLWQVSGRSDITDFEEVVKLDTEYICHFRLSLDLKIILKTVGVLFEHEGAM